MGEGGKIRVFQRLMISDEMWEGVWEMGIGDCEAYCNTGGKFVRL